MHFEASGSNEKARAAETLVFGVIAEDVADILAEETLDTFAEFLNAIDVALVHFPFNAGLGLKGRNLLVDFVIPGNVGDQILDKRKRFQGRDGNWLIERQRIKAGLAGQARATIHFRGAGAALPCFAIPANREIRGLMTLNGMKCIQDDHTWGDWNAVIHRFAVFRAAAKHAQNSLVDETGFHGLVTCQVGHHLFSAEISFSSARFRVPGAVQVI
jgi:hypothetical protein